jgi:hypothetical protein
LKLAAPVAEAQVKLTLVDRVTAGIRRIQARFAALAKSLGFERIARAARLAGKAIRNVGDGLARTSARLGKFIAVLGLGGGGAIAATIGLGKYVAGLSVELDSLSKRAGVSAEALQELQFAVGTKGVNLDGLVDGLKELNLRADEFIASGNGSASEAFKKLGYSAADLKKKLKDPAALFGEIMERLSKLDQSTQIRFTDELFGGSAGEQFQQMIGITAKELRNLRVEARQTGGILGNDVVALGREFTNNLDALLMRLDGFRRRLGAGLLPVLNEAVKTITRWVDANRELIKTRIDEWVKWLVQGVRDLLNPASEIRQRISDIAESFKAWVEWIKPVVEWMGGPLNASLILVGTYIGGPLLASVGLLAAALLNLAAAFFASPIGWVVAGLAAVGAIAYVLIQQWDEFVAYWTGLWGRVTAAFDQGFIKGIATLLQELNPVTHVARGLDAVLEYFTGFSLLDAGSDLIRSLWDGMESAFGRAAAWFQQFVAELWVQINGDAIVDVGRAIIDRIWQGMKDGWGAVKQWFSAAIADMTGWLPDWMKDKMGFSVSVAPSTSTAGPAAAGAASIHSMDMLTTGPVPTSPGGGGDVQAGTVQAGTVQAQSLTVPEPLLVHKPQQIDASVHVGALTVNGGSGTPAEINAAIRNALAAQANQQRAALQSTLSD